MIESDALAAAFGGTPVDLYGEETLRAQLVANREAGVEGAVPVVPDALAAVATQASAEIIGTAWDAARTAHERASHLFEGTLRVPDLSEFATANIDFPHLREGFEGYERAGMKPEIVLAPVNLPLAKWRETYSRLRAWQDEHHPSSGFKLKRQNDGDGLWVWDGVANAWDDLGQQAANQTPGHVLLSDGIAWKALVVPTATREDGGLAVNTSHDLTKKRLTAQAEASGQPETDITEQNAHMPIGAYLTIQATHVLEDAPLMDKDTWTWAHGRFSNGARSPAVRWNPDVGRVSVNCDAVGSSDDSIGARLPVWG